MSTIKYLSKGHKSDPKDEAVVILGLPKNLAQVQFTDVSHKLGDKVSEEEWNDGISALHESSETQYLFSNRVVLAKLPAACSRHNTPSRAHSITKIVKNFNQCVNVVIACQSEDVYASGCAVARAFSLFNKKTSPNVFGSEQATKTTAAAGGKPVHVEFVLPLEDTAITDDDLSALDHAKTGIQLAARIVDTPCNEMHTDAFIDEIKKVKDQLKGVKMVVIQGKDLDDKGFGGIYGVGKAAVHQPALAVLTHEPKGATQTIAWVGKGIVYDTGGLSIKGKTAMPGMKRDCGGAAGILGAFFAAVKQGFKENLHAVFCLAENAVGDRATRPDDVHTLYSGKTVEINNTDAEGRLVVSDGVVYANKDLGASVILDMCTLTGAQGISTGRYHAAHLTNCADWEDKTAKAGLSSGDLSFPLVYCPELHFPEFYSAIADMKNSVADRSNAQSSCAGLFINAHLGFDYPGAWIHVDMAAPVSTGERATGYGVALLNTLFGEHINSPLLQQAVGEENGGSGQGNPKKMRLK